MTTPFVVAVVGAGPSGIYAAEALASNAEVPVEVAVIDRLPTPFGLVRYGVAPDHPSIRSIRATLERTLGRPGVRFFGNVTVGRDLAVSELLDTVDAVIFAYGAGASRRLGIPGEDAAGSLSAPDFVAWYCGHPDGHPAPHPPEPGARPDDIGAQLADAQAAVVVGAGNVALDVARILIKSADDLITTDMADEVITAMRRKSITEVHLLSRRGPEHTQMTTKELREIGRLDGCEVIISPADLDWVAAARDAVGRVAQRNVAELADWAATQRPTGAGKRLYLHFWTRPTALDVVEGRVAGVRIAGTRDGRTPSAEMPPAETPSAEARIPAQLVVRAIGYRGVELPGVPFDPVTGRAPHVEGRLLDSAEPGSPFRVGQYVTGWIKRGPTGVIGTNKADAVETVRSVLRDIVAGEIAPAHPAGLAELADLLRGRGVEALDLEAWRRIDHAEIARGRAGGRERATIARRDDLLRAARDGSDPELG